MRRGIRRVVTLVGLIWLPVAVAQSQPSAAAAAAFARARQLVLDGQAAAGRVPRSARPQSHRTMKSMFP